jgi:tRNA(Ile)-lysidine synthase
VVSAYKEARLKAGKSKIVLDLEKLEGYYKSLRKKVALEAFRKLNRSTYSLSSLSLLRALDVINGKSGGRAPLGKGIFIGKSQKQVSLFRTATGIGSKRLQLPGITELPDCGYYLEADLIKREMVENPKTSPESAFLDFSKLRNLTVRFWKHGDKIKPFGMKGHRLLSDIFIDRKIPEFERDWIPLVMSGKKIAWIAGIMLSDDFKIVPETKKVLALKLCVLS